MFPEGQYLHLKSLVSFPSSSLEYSHISQAGPPFCLDLQYTQDPSFVLKNPCLQAWHLFCCLYSFNLS